MNYGGDLQDKAFTLSECRYSLTGGINYQFSPHFLGNVNLTYGRISASDAKNGPKWFYRNLSFKTGIFEASVTAEADLFDIRNSADQSYKNTENETQKWTPYVFAGVGLFYHNPFTFDQAGKKVYLQPLGTEGQTVPYSLWQVSMPMGVGVKYALSENIFLGAEMNLRATFNDYLDDVSSFHYLDTTELLATHGQQAASLSYRADEIPDTKYAFYGYRGNPNKKDKFYSFTLRIIFKFGEGTSLFKYGYGD